MLGGGINNHLGQIDDFGDRHVALEVAAEGRRDAALFDGHVVAFIALDGAVQLGDLLLGGAVLVARQEAFRGAEIEIALHGQAPGGLGPLETLGVQPEPGIFDARFQIDAGHHLFGVGHVGHQSGIDEGHDLNGFQPGFR